MVVVAVVAGMVALPGRSVDPMVESIAVMVITTMLLAVMITKATGRTAFTTLATETLALNVSSLVLLKIPTVSTLVSTLKSMMISLLKPAVTKFLRLLLL
jgi:hypothetical protein